jgi:hypothetical protein
MTRPAGMGERIKDCVLDFFVGEHLGSGAYRKVFALQHHDDRVIKIETNGIEFCNVAEMKVWQEVEGTPLEHWFAECHEIDAWGLALIQQKTEPFDNETEFHEMVEKIGPLPKFFDDIHWGNFGKIDDRLVCHDYGFTKFLQFGVKGAVAAHEDAEDKQIGFAF